MSLQQQPKIRYNKYRPTIIPIAAPREKKLSIPITPVTTAPMKSRFGIITQRCNDAVCLTGVFFLLKLGSRTLKNMGPNPFANP